jgi:hypothetical protein
MVGDAVSLVSFIGFITWTSSWLIRSSVGMMDLFLD